MYRKNVPQCSDCGSADCSEILGPSFRGLFQCNDCGAFFDDEELQDDDDELLNRKLRADDEFDDEC